MPMLKGKWKKIKKTNKKCETILQKVEMYKEKQNVEKCKKKKKSSREKDLKRDQSQNKNPSYDNKWSLVWSP